LAAKAAVRVFHYKGERIEHSATPNLLKPPVTFSGSIVTQIQQATECMLRELATGVQMGGLGFEIVQKYPVRVIREAITNAVIHRDYSLPADVQVRLFADRIEVDSPGMFPGNITARNVGRAGSFNRNPLVVSNLREFPDPPNLDAGEGVRMMFQTMDCAGLYPPVYLTRATTGRDNVLVVLLNENRPSVWDQIRRYIDKTGSIGNAEVRRIMQTDNTLAAMRVLKDFVNRGLLVVANPSAAKKVRRYTSPEQEPTEPLFAERLRK
jgi:ATP-dependent DNA helicase RecG